ncbi:hypothetical protein V2J09_004742 [Rumex salicifolius]
MAVEILVTYALERVNDLLMAELDLFSSVRSRVQSLRGELTWMRSYLKDADSRYDEGDERFRTSITEIRRIAFDVEDLVDSFLLESSIRRRRNILTRYAFIFQHIVRTHQFGENIKSVESRIQECTDRLVRYGVRASSEILELKNCNPKQSRIRPEYSHVEDDDVVGLDEDIKRLVHQLLDEESMTWVVSIVGMGGSGKTTLARQIYNNACVKQQFGRRAWVSISQSWDKRNVLLEIFRQFVARETFVGSDQALLEELYGFLKDKVYLIVLDDVWKLEAWEDVFPALPRNNGSKVLITTRIESVPLNADPMCIVNDPHILSEEESWELFRRKAFINEESDNGYVKLGKEMLSKCNGLPLAVAALGGLLRTKKGLDEWQRIHKALTSNIMKGKGSPLYGRVDEMLALSYNDLPFYLKPCFLYLGLFPEDSDIKVGMLIRMWIAEGFIRSDQISGEVSLEEIARECLDELIHRCMLQVTRRNHAGKITACRMHDLIRDLCLRKAKEQDFLEILSPSSCLDTSIVQSRRAATHSGFFWPKQSSHLRSLIQFGLATKVVLTSEVSISTNFKLLRVLNLWDFRTHDKALPKQIGTLIHLRYLGIRLTNISQLPNSIGDLQNLLTLDYRRIRDGVDSVQVPNVLWKMAHLRHLYLPRGALHSKEKLGLDTLKNLRTLWGVGGGNWITKEMPKSSSTIQKLAIVSIPNEEQLEAIFRCPSIASDRLYTLHLSWFSLDSDYGTELPRLELSHCEHLRSMILQGRISDELPLRFPQNLTKLELYFSQLKGQDPMEILGKLPNLKIVWLWNAYLGRQMICRNGMFPKLEYLMLSCLLHLEDWVIEEGAMPRLNKLIISTCGELTQLPDGMRFLTALQQLVLQCMSLDLVLNVRRVRDGTINYEEGGEYALMIKKIPSILIK